MVELNHKLNIFLQLQLFAGSFWDFMPLPFDASDCWIGFGLQLLEYCCSVAAVSLHYRQWCCEFGVNAMAATFSTVFCFHLAAFFFQLHLFSSLFLSHLLL